jgi:hypothetical protein
VVVSFQLPDQSVRCLHRPSREALRDLQLIERDQPLIVGGDQVIQDFGFRAFGEADAIGKRLPIALESFSDIPRTRSDRVTQLLDAPVMALEVGRQQEQVDAQVEQMRELPGSEIAEVGGSGHARRMCNRAAVASRDESRVFRAMRPDEGEEIETRRSRHDRNNCRSTMAGRLLGPTPAGRRLGHGFSNNTRNKSWR